MNINIERKYKLFNKRVTVSFNFYSCFLIFLRRDYLQISLEEIICIVSRYLIILFLQLQHYVGFHKLWFIDIHEYSNRWNTDDKGAT